ncbi:MAG TPA: EAL domain-containing protein [Acidimicrobiales bacterium]|nr:EAL domain-containing protein [Acidimicrobiales bacterium]
MAKVVDGRLFGFEALTAWSHPSRGLIPSVLMLSAVDGSRVASEVVSWTLDRACSEWLVWGPGPASPRQTPLVLAVRFSAYQVLAPDFRVSVLRALEIAQFEPEQLVIELPEAALVQDEDRARVVLVELKRAGVRFGLDGFGAGNFSFNYLKRLPIDLVKVDESLTAEVVRDRAAAAVFSAVVSLAHSLGMSTLAQGVDEPAQLDWLAKEGCDLYQGALLAGMEPFPATPADSAA